MYLHRDISRPPQTLRDAPNTQVSNSPNASTLEPLNSSTVNKPVPFVPSPKEQVSFAMDEVIVKSLIAQARTASIKGDAATTGALVKGLKTHRATSEKLLAAEIATSSDPTTRQHLEHILFAISGDPK